MPGSTQGAFQLSSEYKFLCERAALGWGLLLALAPNPKSSSNSYMRCAAAHIKEAALARRVLLAVDGPYVNVVKIKPPMVFAEAEVDRLVATLEEASRAPP